MSVTHLQLGAAAWKFRLSRFWYLCTCWPICCHFLRRRISANRPFQPLPHPSVSVGMKTFCLLLPDGFSKGSIFFGSLHPLYKAVIAASGHCKEPTHYQYRILFPVTVDYCILCLCSHFLPVDRRKSRNNSFSILNRLISYACSAIISPGAESFRGRPFGRGVIPASIFACLWLYRLIQFLICDLLNPNRSAISCRVAPPCRILRISCSNACICVYFLRDIRTPPV